MMTLCSGCCTCTRSKLQTMIDADVQPGVTLGVFLLADRYREDEYQLTDANEIFYVEFENIFSSRKTPKGGVRWRIPE